VSIQVLRFPVRLLAIAGFSIVFASCGGNADVQVQLPTGTQIMTGTLLPAEISLLRRGTHVLQIDGIDVYFVESETENLRRFERKPVVLEGTLSFNVDPSFLPVLEVSRVLDVLEEQRKEWEVRSLGLRLQTPETWEGTVEEGKISLRAPGGTGSVVTVEQMDQSPVDLTNAMPIVVGNARGLRIIDEATGGQIVVLERPKGVIVFSFTPDAPDRAERLRQDWLSLLTDVIITSSNSPVQATGSGALTGSGSTGGVFCGGPAGILCPAGFYCDITHLQENIGVCRGL
jgi:hypothetical protein